ncbi:MAG: leucyl aminopeptidase [Parachlamydiales bacterium]
MLELTTATDVAKRKGAGATILPVWESTGSKKGGVLACPDDPSLKGAERPLELGDFSGKAGKGDLVYTDGGKEKRFLLIGLGKEGELTVEGLRQSYAAAVGIARSARLTSVNVLLPTVKGLSLSDVVRGISEGLLLANESFDRLKFEKLKEETILLKKACLVGVPAKVAAEIESHLAVAEGVHFARDLINRNADDITPQGLGEIVKDLAKSTPKLKATVHGKEWIEKEKMGLLLAVNRGSAHDPAFIILEYKGSPKGKKHTVIVGKGVTYDTGGLNLKPTGHMETMRTDMSGAAAVIGTLLAVAKLGLKVNVTAVVAATENMIDARSYKPGDVYSARTGKTVEIDNTDAEGRLTLADALSYAIDKLNPTEVINLCTLTGAIVVALGEEIAGLMSNNDELAADLVQAGETSGELLWRMPLHKSYKKMLHSDIADIKNCGGRKGSSITAALFIGEFVGKTPWAHLDIAGTAYPDKAAPLSPNRATGYGVRLLIDLLRERG